MAKLRVGVLMGGKSIENEVSFNSGRTICDHLDSERYEIIPLFESTDGTLYILPWNFLYRGKISDFAARLEKEARRIYWDDLKKLIDFVYIAQHGRFAEDGSLQGLLEVLGIPYLGSKVAASALSMDKHVQKKILAAHGVQTPASVTLTPAQIQSYQTNSALLMSSLTTQNLALPLIVKPVFEGSSLGVTVAKKIQDLMPALAKAENAFEGKKQAVIVEEYITGVEFTCVIITDYKTGELVPLPLTEIEREAGSDFYDYEQKYMPGRANKYTPARISPEDTQHIMAICIKTMQALGVTNIIRIDGFLTPDKRVLIFDPNILSGMAPSSFIFRQAAEVNMNHAQLINHLIETELHAYGMLEKTMGTDKERSAMQNIQKTRVAVLLGGRSNEKEISLESGRNVVYKLSADKYEITPLFVTSELELYALDNRLLVHNSTKEIVSHLDESRHILWAQLPELFDFVFIALHGGEGENGSVQGMLEMLHMPYNGSSVLASSLCMDKYKANEFLGSQGFSVPLNTLIEKFEWEKSKQTCAQKIVACLGLPVIVKPHDDGCSTFVSRADTQQELVQALDSFFTTNKTHAFIEELIEGMELTVGVVGNETPQALPPSQTVSNKGILTLEEKFLPGAGENQTPAPLARDILARVQRTIEQVYSSIGCSGYARIDCFYQTAQQSKTGVERIVILEINSLPALTPATCLFHQAAEVGIKPMDFIDTLVKLGFEKHQGVL